jgi:cellulose 1,4-beta-cellobiosidase
MLWLDSSYPPEKAGTPGGDRGPCAQDSGAPTEVESKIPNAYVKS